MDAGQGVRPQRLDVALVVIRRVGGPHGDEHAVVLEPLPQRQRFPLPVRLDVGDEVPPLAGGVGDQRAVAGRPGVLPRLRHLDGVVRRVGQVVGRAVDGVERPPLLNRRPRQVDADRRARGVLHAEQEPAHGLPPPLGEPHLETGRAGAGDREGVRRAGEAGRQADAVLVLRLQRVRLFRRLRRRRAVGRRPGLRGGRSGRILGGVTDGDGDGGRRGRPLPARLGGRAGGSRADGGRLGRRGRGRLVRGDRGRPAAPARQEDAEGRQGRRRGPAGSRRAGWGGV